MEECFQKEKGIWQQTLKDIDRPMKLEVKNSRKLDPLRNAGTKGA